MNTKSTHIVPNTNGGWDIEQSNAQRSSGHFNTKQEAVERGRTISKNQKTEFVIHNQNGRIARKDSHGNDPKSIKG